MKKSNRLLKALLPLAICVNAPGINAQTPSFTPEWTSVYTNTITPANPDNGRAITSFGTSVYMTGVLNKPTTSPDYYTGTFKFSSSGSTTWSKFWNSGTNPSPCGDETGYDIKVDGSGNVWVAGAIVDASTNIASLALWKYNSGGTLQTNYPKTIASTACNGPHVAGGFCLAISGSSVYIGGSKCISGSPTSWYFVVAKDSAGGTGFVWEYDFNNGYTNSNKEHCAVDIEVNGTGVYATGFITNTSLNRDIYTVGLSPTLGTVLAGWTPPVTYAGNGLGDDVGINLGLDAGGNVYVAGWATITSHLKDGFLTKYTSGGSVATGTWPQLWDYTGKDDAWNDLEVINGGTDPAVLVGGYDENAANNINYALTAYTSAGAWATHWPTSPHVVHYDGSASTEPAGTDMGKAIEYSPTTGRVYITGNSSEICVGCLVNPDVNITTLGYNASNGTLAWDSASYDTNSDIVVGDDATYWSHCLRVYYSSCYASDIILVTGGSWSATHNFDYVTIQYGKGSGACNQLPPGEGGRMQHPATQPQEVIGIYPNPFSNTAELRIESGNEVINATLYITDVHGRIVATQTNISSNSFTFNRGNLQVGLYFFKLSQDGAELSNGKFIIAE